jgi:signal recognition particle receptor subunit beta
VFYDASRKLILKGVDGVVFVADSQEARLEANVESIRNLDKNLKEQGYDIATIPYVLQFNKRDLPDRDAADEMYRRLNIKREPTFEAVATTGAGVFDTLKAVARQGADGPQEAVDRSSAFRFVGAALAAAPSSRTDAADVPSRGGGGKPRPYVP